MRLNISLIPISAAQIARRLSPYHFSIGKTPNQRGDGRGTVTVSNADGLHALNMEQEPATSAMLDSERGVSIIRLRQLCWTGAGAYEINMGLLSNRSKRCARLRAGDVQSVGELHHGFSWTTVIRKDMSDLCYAKRAIHFSAGTSVRRTLLFVSSSTSRSTSPNKRALPCHADVLLTMVEEQRA